MSPHEEGPDIVGAIHQTGQSNDNSTAIAEALTALDAALRANGALDAETGAVVSPSDYVVLIAWLRSRGLDAIRHITAELLAGRVALPDLVVAAADASRSGARTLVSSLEPDVPPIGIGVDDLGPVDLATLTDATPPRGPYVDGLLPSAGMTLVAGPAGSGKTWMLLRGCWDAVMRGATAVYLDLDCNGQAALYGRARLLGVSDESIINRQLNVVSPADVAARHKVASADAVRGILKGLEDAPPAILVIDSMAKLVASLGGDENSAADINRALGLLEVLRSRCCVVVIDHIGVSDNASHRPRGSAAKVDTPDAVVMVHPATDDEAVVAVDLSAAKDRHGSLREHLAAPGSGDLLARFVVRRGEPVWTATLTPARAGIPAAQRADAERRYDAAMAVFATGDDGLAMSALVADAHSAGMVRRDAQKWVGKLAAEWVAGGLVEERPVGGGVRLIWVGDEPVSPADETAALHARINAAFGIADNDENDPAA